MGCIYEGTQDYPAGAHLITVPSSQPAPPGPSGQTVQDRIVLTGGDVRTVVTALDIAAACKRDRAEMCAGCPGQSCATCQTRLRDAQAYGGMAGRAMTRETAATNLGRDGNDAAGQPVPAQSPHWDLDLLTPDDVCALLKVKKSWLYDAVEAGALEAIRLGKQLRFRPSALTRYLEERVSNVSGRG